MQLDFGDLSSFIPSGVDLCACCLKLLIPPCPFDVCSSCLAHLAAGNWTCRPITTLTRAEICAMIREELGELEARKCESSR
jgi:hypothetical protein